MNHVGHGGATVKGSDSRSEGCGFEPRWCHRVVHLGKALYLTCLSLPRGEMGSCYEYSPLSAAQRYEHALGIVWQLTCSNDSGINVKRFDTCERRYINDNIYLFILLLSL